MLQRRTCLRRRDCLFLEWKRTYESLRLLADLGVSVQTRVAIGKWWRDNRSDDEKRQDLWMRANSVIKSEILQDNYSSGMRIK